MSVQDICVLWDARVLVPPPGREPVIQELREIHVHPGSCVWWASLDADLEPKCNPIPSVSQVEPQVEKLTSYLVFSFPKKLCGLIKLL